MKAIILCAGYSVRLYPLTEKTPKPLLPVGGRPILDHLLEKVRGVREVNQIYAVSNGKFARNFEKWSKGLKKADVPVRIVNDGTLTNETRLGAIGDLKLVLKQEKIEDDLLVLAGDNYFTFDLSEFVNKALLHKPAPSVGLFDVRDRCLAKNYGLVEVDADGKMTAFFEKPDEPPTTVASTGVYFFPQEILPSLDQYLLEKNNPDAPGYFVKWLAKKKEVYGILLSGIWYDIGDLASYQKLNLLLEKKSVQGENI